MAAKVNAITENQIPKHVAIVMDGNGRWAELRRRPRYFGHVRGSSRVRSIVETASNLGIQALTLYAFSTENWKRPEAERSVLWKLLIKHLKKEIPHLRANNVRLRVMGEIERLPEDVRLAIDVATSELSNCTGMILTFAVSYGSRREILNAAYRWAKEHFETCGQGAVEPSEKTFENYLWTADMHQLAAVDLVIRTSGEQRTSNYLLWQAAYAEYSFVQDLWPDFTPDRFRDVIKEYGQRERRFGNVKK